MDTNELDTSIRRALSAATILCVLACGQDESGGTGPDVPQTPEAPVEPPPSASVPAGTPTLFLETSEDASVFNDIVGTFIEGSAQSFVQFVPETGEAALISTNLSRSFAQSFSFIRSFDDELYLLNASDTGARLSRLDIDALLGSSAETPVPTPRGFDSVSDRCMVVIGDDLIYKVAYREATFPGVGFEDGPLVRVDGFFSDPAGASVTELIAGVGGESLTAGGFVSESCFNGMDLDGGVWYDYRIGRETTAESAITTYTTYTRDVATGTPTARPKELVLEYAAGLDGRFSISNVGYDLGFGYLAALDTETQELTILRFDPEVASSTPELVHAETLTGVGATGVRTLDVDDGYVSLVLMDPGSRTDVIALFDPTSSDLELLDFGVPINQLEIMVRGRAAAASSAAPLPAHAGATAAEPR